MAGPWDERVAKVRIVQRPEGEAPVWVRDAWIGLELPILDSGTVTTAGYGVVTGPRTLFVDWIWSLTGRCKAVSGYRVRADLAVDLLQESSPKAAAWWRENAAYAVRRGAKFIFDKPACEPVD